MAKGKILALVALLVLTAAGLDFLNSKKSGNLEAINFGAIPSGSAILVYIAQDQGFFEKNGLAVNIKDYPTGIGTTDALLAREVEIAWAAELPLIRKAFAQKEIRAFAVSSRFDDQYLFGLRDRGIESLSDLNGKTIGIPKNTIAEFYLARLLEANNLDIKDVRLADVPPPQSQNALASSTIEGVVTWEPFSSQIKKQFADRVAAWPIQRSQPGYGIMMAKPDWLEDNQETVARFLKSLVLAEDFLIRNPAEAKKILKTRIAYDDDFLETFWSENQFFLSLDQSLVLAMEDEARWLINSGLVEETTVPDFLDYISEASLKKIKPGAVNIIR